MPSGGVVASAPVARSTGADAPAPRRPLPVAERIDLGAVRSRMDQTAARSENARTAAALDRMAARSGEGLVSCRCGSRGMGAATGLVPAWFGRDCIERGCPLKEASA